MRNRVFVDNFSPNTTAESIEQLFRPSGKVGSVTIGTDRMDKSSNHAFVEMTTGEEAFAAIRSLNNTDFHGFRLVVTLASPPKERDAGFSGETTSSERRNRSK